MNWSAKLGEAFVALLFGIAGAAIVVLALMHGRHSTAQPPAPVVVAPNTPDEPSCLTLDPPSQVFCLVEGSPLFDERATEICMGELPPRWRVTTTSGAVITVVGGTCYSAFQKRRPDAGVDNDEKEQP